MHSKNTITPESVSVCYNDWRQIDVTPPDAFAPSLSVSVVVPCYETPTALARALAALEGQTYPRELFEVVIVDDGSEPPLLRPRPCDFDVSVVRQENRGFGLARARNTGAAAARHEVLLFLDGDMLPEADWLEAHARWHHAADDLLTQGFYANVAMDGVTADRIRQRCGTLKELLADRAVVPSFMEAHMARTRELTSRDDDLFRVTSGGNIGISRAFYERLGGFDPSFTRWGGEDTEFGYRAYACGAVLVPVRDAFAWHQGHPTPEETLAKRRSQDRQKAKLAHLIAHEDFRDARAGCLFAVPRYVVTLDAGDQAFDEMVEKVETLLADRAYDLVVRVVLGPGVAHRDLLRERFDPDPRVRIDPATDALDEFPSAAFHVSLPAGVWFAAGIVQRLHRELGPAVEAFAMLRDGSRVSIARSWALQRARRSKRPVADFGETTSISVRRLRVANGHRSRPKRLPPAIRPALAKAVRIRRPREAWWFLQWLAGAIRWRIAAGVRAPKAPHVGVGESPNGDSIENACAFSRRRHGN